MFPVKIKFWHEVGSQPVKDNGLEWTLYFLPHRPRHYRVGSDGANEFAPARSRGLDGLDCANGV